MKLILIGDGDQRQLYEQMAEGLGDEATGQCNPDDAKSIQKLVQDRRLGEVFKAGDPEALAEAIVRLLNREDCNEMCLACRKEAEERYSEASNYKQLMDIYREA